VVGEGGGEDGVEALDVDFFLDVVGREGLDDLDEDVE
jgi:hypothetical protein